MCIVIGTDWEDPEDPTVIAENELLGAASSIDAAAKKLANLRPRVSSIKVKHCCTRNLCAHIAFLFCSSRFTLIQVLCFLVVCFPAVRYV